ncbi:MAG: CBS domain-containing protein [Xanthomonadales bacterium]|nr:CBS domain-containing protein [Xanthomonadales bacterium]
MNIEQLLKKKGIEPIIVGPKETIAATARLLAGQNKGLALVCNADKRLLGVVSVMDISRAVAAHAERAPAMAVDEIMTTDFCACELADSAEEALGRMRECRVRHLPIVEQGVLKGLLNMRGVLEHRSEEAEIEASEIRSYIFGAGYH